MTLRFSRIEIVPPVASGAGEFIGAFHDHSSMPQVLLLWELPQTNYDKVLFTWLNSIAAIPAACRPAVSGFSSEHSKHHNLYELIVERRAEMAHARRVAEGEAVARMIE